MIQLIASRLSRAARLLLPRIAATFCTALVASGLLHASAGAQAGAIPVRPGTRVRVSASTLVAPLIANFLQERGDTVVFIEEGAGPGVWTFALSQITRLEQSAGERGSNRPWVVKGMMYGAPAGGLASLAIVSTVNPDSGKEFSRLPSIAVGVAVGALAGALIGSRFAREHWTPVNIARRVTFAPSSRGYRAGLSFSF